MVVRVVSIEGTRVIIETPFTDVFKLGEMEISVDGSMTLTAAHAIAEGVHSEIERQFPRVKHIMIHVNPAETVNSKEK